MGNDIETARGVLLATDRRSLQYIHEKEFKPSCLHKQDDETPASPSPQQDSAPARDAKKPATKRKTPTLDEARTIVRPLVEEG